MRPSTIFGLRARHSSGPRPRRSITPGRNPSMIASACSTRRSTVWTPSGCFRSTAIDRRPRLSTSFSGLSTRAFGRSTRSTSAPMSASIIAVNGPGPMPAISITLTPFSGPAMRSNLSPEQSLRVVGEHGVEGRAFHAATLELRPEVGEQEGVRPLVHLVVDARQHLVEHLLESFGDGVRELRRGQAAHVVLTKANLVGVPGLHKRDDLVGSLVVGSQELVAAAVVADEGPTLGDAAHVIHVGRLTLVTDQGPRQVGAVLAEDLLLHVATHRVLAVADHRQPGFGGRDSGSGDDLSVVLTGRVARCDLDAARLDAGLADAVVDLVEVELGDLLRRPHPPVVRNPDVLEIEARRANDLHPRLTSDLGEELRVSTEVDRARVDERAHAVLGEPRHALHGGRDARPAVEGVARVEGVAGVADAHMLVHERRPELTRVDRPEDGLNGRHDRGTYLRQAGRESS